MRIKNNIDNMRDFSEANIGNVVKNGERYYIVIENIDDNLNCIDLMTGEEHWIYPFEKVQIYEDVELIIKG